MDWNKGFEAVKEMLPITRQLIQELKSGVDKDSPCYGADKPLNVLVVEDDKDDAMFMRTTLEGIFCKVDVARDGIQASKLLRENQNKYCVMFLDLNLPGIDGFGVLRIAHELAPNLHVIIVTGGNRIAEIPMDMYIGVIRKPLRHNLAIEILKKTSAP